VGADVQWGGKNGEGGASSLLCPWSHCMAMIVLRVRRKVGMETDMSGLLGGCSGSAPVSGVGLSAGWE
jgi:hypothetical protein